MSTVDDGAFDLDAALVLVRVDPRRGCAELHRLLAGEAAAYARALGVRDVADVLDEVFDRAFQGVATFAGHGRDFRLAVFGLTAEVADEHLGDTRGTELGVAVLLGVLGCSVSDAAAISGTTPAFVEANRPASAAFRYHRRRFRLDQPPTPGPVLQVHLDPRARHLPPADAEPATTDRSSRTSRRWAIAAALILLLGVVSVIGIAGTSDNPADEVALTATSPDVIVSNPQPTPPAVEVADESDRPDDRSAPGRATPDPVRALEVDPTTWSYDVRSAGRVWGTIDDSGTLAATVVAATGWSVEVDEDTPPWLQATFTNGADTIRFLAIADGAAVRVWVFDLDRADDEELAAAPIATPTPQRPRPRPTPTPDPTPRESPAPRPEPAPPEGGGDLAPPTPSPTPAPPEPTPDQTPTPDESPTPDASPTPDEPDPDPTPDEPDPDPTPDDPDDEESDNSGPGGGGPDPDPDQSGRGSGSSSGASGGDED